MTAAHIAVPLIRTLTTLFGHVQNSSGTEKLTLDQDDLTDLIHATLGPSYELVFPR